MAKKLAREKLDFIHWLAMPDTEREVNTQRALAEKLHVHEVTLSEWRHQKDVVAEVNRLVDEHFGDEYAEIAHSFKKQAKKGSFPHQKLYFEMTGKYMPKQAIELSGNVELVEVVRDNAGSSDT